MNADQISFDDLAVPRDASDIEEDCDDDTSVSSINLSGIWGLFNTVSGSINATAPSTTSVTGNSITQNSNGTYTYTVGGTTTTGTAPGPTGATGNPGPPGITITNPGTKIQIKSTPDDAFDLTELGVTQIGSFDSTGNPTNWNVTMNAVPIHYPTFMHTEPVMYLDNIGDYRVYFRGVYSKKYTNERRAAMGLPAL